MILVGLVLALYFHLGLYDPPTGMVDETEVRSNGTGNQTIQIDSSRLIGIGSQIDFDTPDQGSGQISELWSNFFADVVLQSAVDWSESQVVLAYYDAFSTDRNTATLVVGFLEPDLQDSSMYVSTNLASGNYIHYKLVSPTVEAVNKKWVEVMGEAPYPSAVIERYALDTLSQPQQIQMQVLYQ